MIGGKQEQILVFPVEALSSGGGFQGFTAKTDLLPSILDSAFAMDRIRAEVHLGFKQLVTYALFTAENMVFRYRRSSRGKEWRLHGAYSLGIGGHVMQTDVQLPLAGNVSLLEIGRDREVAEEFVLPSIRRCDLVGLINDDADDVGRVHFGIVYRYELTEASVTPREKRAFSEWGFVDLPDLMESVPTFERWSQILIESYIRHETGGP